MNHYQIIKVFPQDVTRNIFWMYAHTIGFLKRFSIVYVVCENIIQRLTMLGYR